MTGLEQIIEYISIFYVAAIKLCQELTMFYLAPGTFSVFYSHFAKEGHRTRNKYCGICMFYNILLT